MLSESNKNNLLAITQHNGLKKDPALSSKGQHTLHQVAYELKQYQRQNPKELLIIVGASFSWPAKLSQKLHKLKHIQLIFSGNIFKYNKETNQYHPKNNMGPEHISAFRHHCKSIGLTPKKILKHKITLFDMIKSGAGLLSVKYLLMKWIIEEFGKNSLKARVASQNIKLLYFQDPIAKSHHPAEKLPGYELAEELKFSGNNMHISILADNDINRLIPSNKAENYQWLSPYTSSQTSTKLYQLTQFRGPKISTNKILKEHRLSQLYFTENKAIIPYKKPTNN